MPEADASSSRMPSRASASGRRIWDFVIVRSDAPRLHLANVGRRLCVHVIRGDHVETPSAPADLPCHGAGRRSATPMIVNHGQPYSKRDGAAFVGDSRRRFLPEALFFLALLGWARATTEIATRGEMVGPSTLTAASPAPRASPQAHRMNGSMRRLPRPWMPPSTKRLAAGARSGLCHGRGVKADSRPDPAHQIFGGCGHRLFLHGRFRLRQGRRETLRRKARTSAEGRGDVRSLWPHA